MTLVSYLKTQGLTSLAFHSVMNPMTPRGDISKYSYSVYIADKEEFNRLHREISSVIPEGRMTVRRSFKNIEPSYFSVCAITKKSVLLLLKHNEEILERVCILSRNK